MLILALVLCYICGILKGCVSALMIVESTSDYSYCLVVSASGTCHVMRRTDVTYSDKESYHSSQDDDENKRRRLVNRKS